MGNANAWCGRGLVIGAIVVASMGSRALAFESPPLGADNLLNNPWFRSVSDPNVPGLDGWFDASDVEMGLGQKASNPSADLLTAAECGGVPAYCGTTIRWAELRPTCDPWRVNRVGAISQVVSPARASDRRLRFSTWWVAHQLDFAEVVVYGRDTPSAAWNPVWTPFHASSASIAGSSGADLARWCCTAHPSLCGGGGGGGGDRSVEWQCLSALTPEVEIVLAHAWAQYKIEVRVRFSSPDCGGGFKMTGLYFATAPAGGSTPDGGPAPGVDAGAPSGDAGPRADGGPHGRRDGGGGASLDAGGSVPDRDAATTAGGGDQGPSIADAGGASNGDHGDPARPPMDDREPNSVVVSDGGGVSLTGSVDMSGGCAVSRAVEHRDAGHRFGAWLVVGGALVAARRRRWQRRLRSHVLRDRGRASSSARAPLP